MVTLLELEGVRASYGGPPVLENVGVRVPAGEVLGIVGPNSSGKTTLLRLASRVLQPEAGVVRVAGRDLRALRRREVARLVAVVPQELSAAFALTVREAVLMGRTPHAGRFFEDRADLEAAEAALAEAGVLSLAEKFLGELAGGERQRVAIARALAQQAPLLLLDEPTAHLDVGHQREVVALVRRLNRERGVTIVMVSHDLNVAAACCHRLLLLFRGRVRRVGPPEEVMQPDVIAEVYGCPVGVGRPTGAASPCIFPLLDG